MVKSVTVEIARAGCESVSLVVFEHPEACPVPVLAEQPRPADSFDRTGFILYEAARALATFLLAVSPNSATSNRALELGAGACGLSGLVLAKRGWEVTLTDVPDILEALALSVARNAPQAATSPLRWGDSEACEAMGTFDLVVGSDVVYKRSMIAPLVDTLWLTCKREAYICCEQREEGVLEEFATQAKAKGFTCKRIKKLPGMEDVHYIWLFHLRKSLGKR